MSIAFVDAGRNWAQATLTMSDIVLCADFVVYRDIPLSSSGEKCVP